tara:strand:+ start:51 stop:905 length:855 start_codon:yes stop_codon:yes gene_type:complete
MFNEFGIPMSDAEMSMLPPGQNKPHQKMMAESGVEMSLIIGALAAPIAAGVFGASSILGNTSRQRIAQQEEANRQYELQQQQLANATAQQAYKHEFDSIMLDIENQRTQEIFDIKLDLYDDQLQINRDAANSAYSSEQFRLNELMQQASLNRNRMFKEVLQVQGAQAARGESGNRSRARADLINSLGEYGRDQAEFDKTVYSARHAHEQRMQGIAGQHADANYSAWTQIAISPRLKLPGQGEGPTTRNTVGPARINTQIGFGDITGALSQGLMIGAGVNTLTGA